MASRKKPGRKTGRGRAAAAAAKRAPKPVAESPPPARRLRTRQPPPPLPPPTSTLQQELLEMARGGARTLRHLLVTLFVIAGLAGFGYIAWSLRPMPAFSSEAAEEGSPFDTVFRVENTSTWLALAHLRLGCVLAQVRASGIEPTLVEAEQVALPANGVAGLRPGETATFHCPFRALIGHPIVQDPEMAKRAEIYFRATYDVPFLAEWLKFLRITDDSGRFFLDLRLLPPRWMPVEESRR